MAALLQQPTSPLELWTGLQSAAGQESAGGGQQHSEEAAADRLQRWGKDKAATRLAQAAPGAGALLEGAAAAAAADAAARAREAAAAAAGAAQWAQQTPPGPGGQDFPAAAADPAGFALRLAGGTQAAWAEAACLAAQALAAPSLEQADEGLHGLRPHADARGAERGEQEQDLFPLFRQLHGSGLQLQEDPKRFSRWLSPLPCGRLPPDKVIAYWARTVPAGCPLVSGRFASLSFFPKGSSRPDGLLIRPGSKGGSVSIYLRKSGRVLLAGSLEAKLWLLSAVEPWTVQYGNGAPPLEGKASFPPFRAHLLPSSSFTA